MKAKLNRASFITPSLCLAICFSLSGCGLFPKKYSSKLENGLSINSRGEWIPGEELQYPANNQEFFLINKIINAINTGEVGQEEWWRREFKMRHNIQIQPSSDKEDSENGLTLKNWFDRKYKNDLQYCTKKSAIGCQQGFWQDINKEFVTFLEQSGIGWDDVITIKKDRFITGKNEFVLPDKLHLTKYELISSGGGGNKEIRKITYFNIHLILRPIQHPVSLLYPLLPDYKEIPRTNIERYLVNDGNVFVFSKNGNSNKHHNTPCYIDSVLNKECMPVHGLLVFNYFIKG